MATRDSCVTQMADLTSRTSVNSVDTSTENGGPTEYKLRWADDYQRQIAQNRQEAARHFEKKVREKARTRSGDEEAPLVVCRGYQVAGHVIRGRPRGWRDHTSSSTVFGFQAYRGEVPYHCERCGTRWVEDLGRKGFTG